jgi:hypothetical protein
LRAQSAENTNERDKSIRTTYLTALNRTATATLRPGRSGRDNSGDIKLNAGVEGDKAPPPPPPPPLPLPLPPPLPLLPVALVPSDIAAASATVHPPIEENKHKVNKEKNKE